MNPSEAQENWEAVLRVPLAEIPDDRGLPVEIDGEPVALFRVGEVIHAIENICPHAGYPLEDGWLSGSMLICPWHGWAFDVTDGSCLTCTFVQLKHYPTRIDGDHVAIGPAPSPEAR